jgi:influenza virus NS1A-binding protein
MMEPRRGCGAAEKNGLIYIVGGTNGSCSLKSTEIYNTYTNRFSGGPELNVPRANVAIAFIGTIVILTSSLLVRVKLIDFFISKGNYLFAVGGFDGKQFLRTIEYLNCDDLAPGWSIYHKPMHS